MQPSHRNEENLRKDLVRSDEKLRSEQNKRQESLRCHKREEGLRRQKSNEDLRERIYGKKQDPDLEARVKAIEEKIMAIEELMDF